MTTTPSKPATSLRGTVLFAFAVGAVAAIALTALKAPADAAAPKPTPFVYRGELSWDGVPFDGSATLIFTLHRGDTHDNIGWSETQVVSVYRGAFSAVVGSVSPLPEGALDPSDAWSLAVAASKDGTNFVQLTGFQSLRPVAASIATAYGMTEFRAGQLIIGGGASIAGPTHVDGHASFGASTLVSPAATPVTMHNLVVEGDLTVQANLVDAYAGDRFLLRPVATDPASATKFCVNQQVGHNASGGPSCLTWVCTPDCAGKVCGDNGCGGTCGSCGANEFCDDGGQCVQAAHCTAASDCPDPATQICSVTTRQCAAFECDATHACASGETCAVQTGGVEGGTCVRTCTVGGTDCGDDQTCFPQGILGDGICLFANGTTPTTNCSTGNIETTCAPGAVCYGAEGGSTTCGKVCAYWDPAPGCAVQDTCILQHFCVPSDALGADGAGLGAACSQADGTFCAVGQGGRSAGLCVNGTCTQICRLDGQDCGSGTCEPDLADASIGLCH